MFYIRGCPTAWTILYDKAVVSPRPLELSNVNGLSHPIFFDSVSPAPHLCITFGTQNILNRWLTEKCGKVQDDSAVYVGADQPRGGNVGLTCSGNCATRNVQESIILEEYIGLVSIRRGCSQVRHQTGIW